MLFGWRAILHPPESANIFAEASASSAMDSNPAISALGLPPLDGSPVTLIALPSDRKSWDLLFVHGEIDDHPDMSPDSKPSWKKAIENCRPWIL